MSELSGCGALQSGAQCGDWDGLWRTTIWGTARGLGRNGTVSQGAELVSGRRRTSGAQRGDWEGMGRSVRRLSSSLDGDGRLRPAVTAVRPLSDPHGPAGPGHKQTTTDLVSQNWARRSGPLHKSTTQKLALDFSLQRVHCPHLAQSELWSRGSGTTNWTPTPTPTPIINPASLLRLRATPTPQPWAQTLTGKSFNEKTHSPDGFPIR